MPNTLVHIAIQAPLSRRIFRKGEIPWILVGAIIPDIPWILQRLAFAVKLADPYQLRLYFTVQASLFFCVILCAGIATFSRNSLRIFYLLVFNVTAHLLLDALQIKWGNGVHLFAPFSWQLTSYNMLWPEHILGYCLAAFAIIYLAVNHKTLVREGLNIKLPRGKKIVLAALALFVYLALPFVFMDGLQQSNSSYILTLIENDQRTGKHIELDRVYYSAQDRKITVFTGESFTISGNTPMASGTVSLRGKFTTPHIINSDAFHLHNGYRNKASYLGLLLSLGIWGYLLVSCQVRNVAK